ncbi:MAG: YceI family protein [Deltaproteobacteria bacterium]|nr:YceI family protein [Deltaproteobacteria bacterium]
MEVTSMFRFDPTTADCTVRTFKEGPLAVLGYDLVLRVSRFAVDVDQRRGAIEARFDPGSIVVVGERRETGAEPALLPEAKRLTIERAIAAQVLEAARHRDIVFHSTYFVRRGECVEVLGRLTLHGREQPLGFLVAPQGDHFRAKARVYQPDFGITPYRMLLGGLRVHPYVDVELKLPAAPILGLEREAPIQAESPHLAVPPL